MAGLERVEAARAAAQRERARAADAPRPRPSSGSPPGRRSSPATPDTMSAAVGSGAVGEHAAHFYLGTSSWLSCHVSLQEDRSAARDRLAAERAARPLPGLRASSRPRAPRWRWCATAGSPGRRGEAATTRSPSSPRRRRAGSGGVLFIPWLNGERTPVDDHLVRGGWLNLSLDTTRAQLVRAVLEGVALNARWMQGPVERFCKRRLDPIAFIGGGARSPLWSQILADVLGREIRADRRPDPRQRARRGLPGRDRARRAARRGRSRPRRHGRGVSRRDPARATLRRASTDEFVKVYKATKPIYAPPEPDATEMTSRRADPLDEIEAALKPYRGRLHAYERLPAAGRAREEILDELALMADGERAALAGAGASPAPSTRATPSTSRSSTRSTRSTRRATRCTSTSGPARRSSRPRSSSMTAGMLGADGARATPICGTVTLRRHRVASCWR